MSETDFRKVTLAGILLLLIVTAFMQERIGVLEKQFNDLSEYVVRVDQKYAGAAR